jgi:hypothetical protein
VVADEAVLELVGELLEHREVVVRCHVGPGLADLPGDDCAIHRPTVPE